MAVIRIRVGGGNDGWQRSNGWGGDEHGQKAPRTDIYERWGRGGWDEWSVISAEEEGKELIDHM